MGCLIASSWSRFRALFLVCVFRSGTVAVPLAAKWKTLRRIRPERIKKIPIRKRLPVSGRLVRRLINMLRIRAILLPKGHIT
jgi:hypothetical protein